MNCDELKEKLDAIPEEDCFSISTSESEGGKKFSFINPDRKSICRVHVDNCLIKDKSTKKCDYLFSVKEDSLFYLVEFKGINVHEAIEQILSTYEIINKKVQQQAHHFRGIVVSSSVPSATEQKFRKLQEKCFREKRLKITKTHIQHFEKI